MFNILVVETTGKYGSAAVITDDGRVFCASSETEMNHLRDIITISDEALRAAGITKRDLTHIAASRGPGSFTGIRIGVTTARTMAQMLGLPCIGISSLESLAQGALETAVLSGALYIASVINARRHQTYAGVWKVCFTSGSSEHTVIPVLEERQYMIEELLGKLTDPAVTGGGKVFFTGDGIDAYREIIEEAFDEKGLSDQLILADKEIRYQSAEPAARIAYRMASLGSCVSYEELMPEYMRLSEAEQRLREGTLSDKIRKAGRI